MKITRLPAILGAVVLASLIGVGCGPQQRDTVGYDSPATTDRDFDRPIGEPADPLGQPDYTAPERDEPIFTEPIEQPQTQQPQTDPQQDMPTDRPYIDPEPGEPIQQDEQTMPN